MLSIGEGTHVSLTSPLSPSEFNEIYIAVLVKLPNIEFHENLFTGSLVVTCGRTDRHGVAYTRIITPPS
jgi:hypothetical protein